jgi:hypothetical protein
VPCVKVLKGDHCSDNVDNGINRADFMKMNLCGLFAMHCRLSLCQPLKNRNTAFFNACAEFAAADHLFNINKGAMMVIMARSFLFRGDYNPQAPAGYAMTHGRPDLKTIVAQRKLIQLRNQMPSGHSQINQGRKGHIATDTAKTVKVKTTHARGLSEI